MDPAIDFLKDLGEHYYRPGIVSAVVTLYHHRGMVDKAGQVLKDAVEHYRKTGVSFFEILQGLAMFSNLT